MTHADRSRLGLWAATLAMALMGVPPVAIEGPSRPPASREAARLQVPHNAEAASTSQVDDLLPSGESGLDLTGQGVLVGEWDVAGVRATHVELVGRVATRDGSGVTDHSTHVAGTLIGAGTLDSASRGMAPAARLLSHDWVLDLAEVRELARYLAVSVHAYSDALGWAENPACPDEPSWLGRADELEDRDFGRYGKKAAAIDALVYETELLMVWAGGNERSDIGVPAGQMHRHFPDCEQTHDDEHVSELVAEYDTMGGQLAAKNVLVVGASAPTPDGPSDPADIVPLAFSSYGPMDDGRIKPDLVAAGAHLFSTAGASDDAYVRLSGTSGSAAVVAGGVALLTEHVRACLGRDLGADEWRALLVHTARPANVEQAPTYQTGFGLFDARAAAELISAETLDNPERRLQPGLLEGEGTIAHVMAEVAAGTPLRVTLAWTDPPAPANTRGLDDATRALVNDLDLVLIAPDGSTAFRAWALDASAPEQPAARSGNRVDNVEVVDVSGPENTWTGAWTARVELHDRPFRLRPQRYALASSVPLSAQDAPVLAARRQVLVEATVGTSPAAVELTMDNLGRGSLAWSASDNASWLALGTEMGTAGDALLLSFDTAALPAGRHFAIVQLDAEEAPPAAIGVVLHLRCTQQCDGLECGVDPACGEPCGACSARAACDATGVCVPLVQGCPGTDLGTSTGMVVASGTSELAGDDDSGSCGGTDGEDLAFTWHPPEPGLYRFSTVGSALDTVLYLRAACGGSELACNDDGDGHASSLTIQLDTVDPIQVVVDGKGAGPFQLHIARAPCPQVDLGQRLGSAVYEGNLRGADDARRSPCSDVSDRDVAFGWTAPATDTYRVTAEGASSIAVLTSCDGEALGCDEASGPDTPAAATLELEEGQRVAFGLELRPPYDLRLGIHAAAGQCAGSCGGSPDGTCWCDRSCVELGDCCQDACALCGACCDAECDGKNCGPDGCGGTCGTCDGGERCDEGQCVADECVALQDGAACDDGSACTRGDQCVGGRCAGRAARCGDDERCDEATGDCVSEVRPGADGGSAPGPSCVAGDREGAVCSDLEDAGPPAAAGMPDAAATLDMHHAAAEGCGCRSASPNQRAPVPAGAMLAALIAVRLCRNARRRARRVAPA